MVKSPWKSMLHDEAAGEIANGLKWQSENRETVNRVR